MKLYIAGPMTGLPNMNYPAFYDAEKKLVNAGYNIENPAANENPDPDDYIEWLRLGLRQVLKCDAVAVLPGFGMSKGAMLEIHVAAFLKMPVRTVEEWLIQAYWENHPPDEDEGPESNPLCNRCGHSRGLHEIYGDMPYGYCVHVDCDCTAFVSP